MFCCTIPKNFRLSSFFKNSFPLYELFTRPVKRKAETKRKRVKESSGQVPEACCSPQKNARYLLYQEEEEEVVPRRQAATKKGKTKAMTIQTADKTDRQAGIGK